MCHASRAMQPTRYLQPETRPHFGYDSGMKFTIRFLFVATAVCALGVATFCGCPGKARLDLIKEGMTETEVREITIAEPSHTGHRGEGRQYYWSWSDSGRFGGVVVVTFSADGRVIEAVAD